MWGNLLFISEKNYNEDVEAFVKKLDEYSFLRDIPETYYKDLDDPEIVEWYENEKLHILRTSLFSKKKACKTSNSNISESQKKKYELIKANDMAGYINLLPEYNVRDGKIYTTRNYIDGLFDFCSDPIRDLIKTKSGTFVSDCQLKDANFNSFDWVTLMINEVNNTHMERELCLSDYDISQWNKQLIKQLKNTNPDLYIYSLRYHF